MMVFIFEGPRVTASGYKWISTVDSGISYPLPRPQETTMRSLSSDVETVRQLPVVKLGHTEPQGLSPQ